MSELRVLMVGNAPIVKGGITSVISQLLNHNWENDGIKMTFIPTYEGGSAIHKVIYFTKAYYEIKEQIRLEKPNIIHIHMSYKGSFIRKYKIHRLCMKNGISDVIHLHGSEFKKWYDTVNSRTQDKIRRMLRECGSLIVLGKTWEDTIKEIEPKTKIAVVSNTVKIPDETCAWNEEEFRVLYLGVLIKRKGVTDLLKAIKILKDFGDISNIKFTIAGSGEEEQALRDEARLLNIEDCTDFVGWISGDEKNDLLKNSQLLVLPSYNEGLPIAILEALSYGLPVVATNVGDIPSAVKDEKNGYLINPGDVENLSSKIVEISSNKREYERMSKTAKLVAQSEFSEAKYFDRLIECYKRSVTNSEKVIL